MKAQEIDHKVSDGAGLDYFAWDLWLAVSFLLLGACHRSKREVGSEPEGNSIKSGSKLSSERLRPPSMRDGRWQTDIPGYRLARPLGEPRPSQPG
eukprot:g23634.t1